jgi:hypothetical protein
MAWNSIPASQPHHWTRQECAEYEGRIERSMGNNDWIWIGKLTESCVAHGGPS